MKKDKKRRLEALVLAVALGVTSITGYERLLGKKEVYAAEPDTIIFAEGEGTGKEFSNASWSFDSKMETGDLPEDSPIIDQLIDRTDSSIIYEPGKPGIVRNQYSADGEKVIRLINDVKSKKDENGKTIEDINREGFKFNYFRSGKAILGKDDEDKQIVLNEDKDFSMKFTFSMPEAVIDPERGGGDDYTREVGGDGICFYMTSKAGQEPGTGSGIGYHGIEQSFAIELDSFYNGAYYTAEGGAWAIANSGFDNQAVNNYDNHKNKDHNERYDHIAIVANGDVRNHLASYYMDGITKNSDLNLTNGRKFLEDNQDRVSVPSDSKDCGTRFADTGVNDRLFTVWVEYNGKTDMMSVSIANGDFKSAIRPAEPQILQNINLDDYLEENPDTAENAVYMGFTSAVGTSKANHTIHAFQFTNKYEPITNKAQYKVEYYLQDKNDSTKYNKKTEDTVTEDDATVEDVVKDTDKGYKRTYDGYEYTTVDGESVSEIVVAADGTSVLKLYYNLKDTAKYKLNYHLKNKTTGEYEKVAMSEVKTGYVGDEVFAEDVDDSYSSKYAAQHYALSTTKTQNLSTTLETKDEVYEMDVYYDPAEATYQLHYWLYNPSTDRYEEKTDDASPVKAGFVGDSYSASDVDGTYAVKYSTSHYVLSTTKAQEDNVTLAENGVKYDMNVYYDPEVASYRLNYWKYNSETGEYEKTETTQPKDGYVGEEYEITDVDPNYGTKYENYKVNTSKNEKFRVTLDEAGITYEMDVYYDPEEAGYKLNYYKLNPDTGEYEYIESTTVKKGEVGKDYTITDADSEYENKYTADGYTVNATKNEDYSITIVDKDKTYEMNVYYDPPKTTYKTEYYLEQPDGSFKKEDEITSGETYAGKTVSAEEKTYDGYTHVIVDESLETDFVKPDGSTTLKVYYKYPAPKYKTEYYVEQEDGTYKLYTSKDDDGDTGEEVEAEIINIEGYEHTTVPESHEKDTVKADSSTVLKVYYNKVKGPSYKVQYYVEQEDGTYKIYTEKKDIPGTAGEEVEAEIITIDGYEHTTTPDTLEKDTVKEDNSTVLKVYYNKVKDPVYTVQYYVQQKDGKYKLYTEKTNLKGKEGEEVKADIIKIPGYVHTTTDDSNEKDVVNGDGSTVLKVYYNKVEDPVYTVQYYVQQKDGTYKLYTEKTNLKGKEGEEVKADIIKIPGYVHTTTDDSNEKDVVNGDGSTVLKVYYDIEPEEPTTEEPTTEEPTTEEPTTEEPTTEEPTTEEPTTEKPTVEEPTTQPPTTKAPVKEVKTGDSTSNSLFVMLLSAMAVAYGCFFGRKKKNEE
ncbi:MAG: hypothetical protein HDT39_09350 [Lachnospiraceae bacterium]|nr:hypothetical protein [Lachnospiraceae bacterium]